jgi:ribosomal protein S18 acetylase RimI-like enzyme
MPAHFMREFISMNPQVIIRQASLEDALAVQACVTAAFEGYIERIGKSPAPMLLDFPGSIAAQQVWVADLDSQVVGVLVQYETEAGFYIDTVAVSPPCQGGGVGKALLQFAESEALRRGFDSIYLCTNVKMIENQRLYPKIGYVEFEHQDASGYDRIYYRKQLAVA